MKVFAFVDTHGNNTKIAALKEKAKKADILICAGDLTMFEDRLLEHLKTLNGIGPQVLLIHGNHEEEHTLRIACKPHEKLLNIHKGFFKKGENVFLGYGGGGFSMVDLEFEQLEDKFKKHMQGKNTVLILHGPPYGTNLDKLDRGHVGNNSYTTFIRRHQPKLVICGHLHENAGKKDKIGNSLVVNPGPDGMMFYI
ncbi:MAG: metallophosphoesterase family protein [archaeon]